MFHILRKDVGLHVDKLDEDALRNGLKFDWKKTEDGLVLFVFHCDDEHKTQELWTALVLKVVDYKTATSNEFRKLNEIIAEEAKKYLVKGNKDYNDLPTVIELAAKYNSKSRTDNGPTVKEIFNWQVIIEKNSDGFHELKPTAFALKR